MEEFELHGVKLQIPTGCLTDKVRERLTTGTYEFQERMAMMQHLREEDVLLEFGSGAGFLGSLAAKVIGGRNVAAVEASPVMVEVLEQNLATNGAGDAMVLHGAVVGADYEDETVRFAMASAFWGSSIAGNDTGEEHHISEVPAVRACDLFEAFSPTFVVMDIEGAEVELAMQPWPAEVRMVVMEIHPDLYPATTIKEIFDGMSDSGFTYMPWGSRGKVLTFQRVGDGVARGNEDASLALLGQDWRR